MRCFASSRAVSITSHFSFSSIPKSDYKPRAADDRIGYFLTARKDYTLPGAETPFARYINRWKLEKANPSAELSPPKKPIIFYIEKSVPYEYRPIVREALLEWNKAFEKAGFINAIEVRYQEDDATWDAEDVRYFVDRFAPADKWRILDYFFDQTTFFDIETLGLQYDASITVIVCWHDGQFRIFVEHENLDDFLELLDDARLLASFNGASFDVPRVLNSFHIPTLPCAHLDLRWSCYHQGHSGGLWCCRPWGE